MDYGSLPPEINSARIYAGPGSAPMMAAASAWNGLAAELGSTADSYQSVVSGLASEEWLGPASASMAAAAAPYVAWMSTTAAQAQKAATQAQAAAAAFEAAFAMTVPPPVVAANRAQLATLVATNVMGQNTPAIAANEAHYGEMWAQDSAAMYGYAASSAGAAQLTPFSSPAQTANPAGVAGQAAAVTQATGTAASSNAQVAQLVSTLPNAIQGLSSPVAPTADATSALSGLTGLLSSLDGVIADPGVDVILNGISSGGATAMMYIPSTLVPSMIGYFAGAGGNAANGLVGPFGGLGALLAPGGALGDLGALGGGVTGAAAGTSALSAGLTGTTAVSAGLGQASTVGTLTVPPSWAAATPATAVSGTLQGGGWAAAPENHTLAAMPSGMGPGGLGGRGSFGFGTPRYGFKPTVMARPVVAG